MKKGTMMKAQSIAAQGLVRRARWRMPEIVFWMLAFGALLLRPASTCC
jgi:hypothetical protein